MLEPRFPEPIRSKNPQGANRKWPRWLIVALALLQNSLHYTWREFTKQLQCHEDLLIEFGAVKIPSTSSIYAAWRDIPTSQLENLVKLTGRIISPNPTTAAFDSTGFLFKGGSVWIKLKWAKSKLKKTSRLFYKAHIIADLDTSAVLAVKLSKSPVHDLTLAWKLIDSVGKRIIKKIKWFYGDKAYTDIKLFNYFKKYKV